MSRDGVLDRIRRLHRAPGGLFRVHRADPGLYARARRFFGSWATAVSAAGIDYQRVLHRAMGRSAQARRNRRDAAQR